MLVDGLGYDDSRIIRPKIQKQRTAVTEHRDELLIPYPGGIKIDIIAEKADIIAFVEVKTREHGSLTSAEEAVDPVKQRRIVQTAQAFCKGILEPVCCRFDVAAVELENGRVKKLRYYVNAFDASVK